MSSLALVIESAVALLLVITVGYCMVLERRMRVFRTEQEALRDLIGALDRATAQAESAVAGLGRTAQETEAALDCRLREARALSRTLAVAVAGSKAGAARRSANGEGRRREPATAGPGGTGQAERR